MKRTLLLLQNRYSLFLIILVFILTAVGQSAMAQTQSQTFTTSGTFTVPAGVASVTVECWGGGGAGGGNNTKASNGGGGGAGGAYVKKNVSVVSGTYIVTVAAAKAGTTGAGPQGDPSWFDAVGTVYAEGGAGGAAPNGGNVSGGTGSISNSIGDVKNAGGNGAGGTATLGGGGGGGAGTSGAGGNASGTNAGVGRTNGGGNGGAGSATENDGIAGVVAGGGGGGAYVPRKTSHVGGNGAAGQVIISYTCTTYSMTGASAINTCAANGTSTITVNSTSAGMPVGNYTVTYSRSAPVASGLTAAMTVTTAGSGTFTANGLTTAGNQTITITSIGSGSGNGVNSLCNSIIGSNNSASVLVSDVPGQAGAITGNTTVCPGSIQTYSVIHVPGVTYTWQLPSGWTQASGGTSNLITVNAGAGSGNIQVTPSNSCGNGTAGTMAVTLGSPVITGTSPGSRCGAGSVTIGATASAGTINWYATSSGGSSMGTGNIFTTPVISSTTTFYAEANNGGCASARSAVIATIIPPASIVANGAGTYCSGSTVNLTSTGTNIANQYWIGPNGFYSQNQNPVLINTTTAMTGTYTVTGSALSGINLVTNGDFESGNTGFVSGYVLAAQTTTGLVPEGTFDVLTFPSLRHPNFCSLCGDHTSGSGLQMAINGSLIAGINIWKQTLVNVVPNTDYQFTYWLQTIVIGNDPAPSQLQFYVNGIPAGPIKYADPTTGVWTQFTYNWNSGASTVANLSLVNQNTVAGGNDFALDDIVFQQACSATDAEVVTINADVTAGSIGTNQTICSGRMPAAITYTTAGTGSGTISYEWQTNASGSYVTIAGATAATFSPPALTATTSYQRRTVSISGGTTCYSPYTTAVTITVAGPVATAGGPNTVCQAGSPAAIPMAGASFSGTATSAAWSVVSGGGTLSSTAALNTNALVSAVTYTPAANYSGTAILRLTTNTVGGCSSISDRTITINGIATSVAGTALTTCSNSGAVNITAGSSATNYSLVTWTSNGTGTFASANSLTACTYTPSAADITAGSRTLTLTATGNAPCGNAVSTKTLTITPLPVATFSYAGSPYCKNAVNPSPAFIGGGVAGTFSSTAGLVFVSATTGQINLAASNAGTYTVTNTIAASGGCALVTATSNITITTLPAATISYGGTQFCSNAGVQSVTISGTGAYSGGAYSSTAGLSINSGTGAITPATSTAGTYTVTYTMAPTGGCSVQTATATVTITPLPVATFSYAGSPYCKNAVNPSPAFIGGGVAGTFSSTAGLVFVSATTGQINLAASNAGTYTVTNTIAASGGCALVTATSNITITTLPAATISYGGTQFCSNAGVQSVTISGTGAYSGGAYSSTAGLSINSGTGAITPATSTAGTYTVTYTMAPTGGCSVQTATATVTITPLPVATFSYAGSPYCKNAVNPSPAFIGGGVAGTFSSTAGLVFVSATTGQINLAASNAGTYTVTNSIVASGGCGIITATTFVTISLDGSWTGAINQDWNNPGNWACNQLPSLATNVIIANGKPNYPTLSSGPKDKSNNLTIESGASLVVTGNTLQIGGTILNSGTFTATNGSIEMKGIAAQTIGANIFAANTLMNLTINNSAGTTLQGPLNVTGIVTALNGNLTSAGYLTLVSSSAQTALIDGIGSGNVLGNVNIQRYLPSAFGYKYFSSPFQAATVGELSQEVNLSASFPTFYKYDENNSIDSSGVAVYPSGWAKYINPANPLIPLTGYAANLGKGSSVIIASMTGLVNNGNLQTILFNHNRKYTKGFNLIGNPYPSPIDWNASGWTKTNIDNALYFFNASGSQYSGAYSSYVNGVSSGMADNVIATMQGFFVHVSNGAIPVNATLVITNPVRINNLNPSFKNAVLDNRAILRFTANFETNNAIEDAAVIYFDNNASLGFNADLDALKMTNTDFLVPNLYTLTPELRPLSINGMPFPTDSISSIPLGITTFTEGWINLNANDITQLPAYLQIYLLDTETGKFRDLKQMPEDRFYLKAGEFNHRFSLVFSLSDLLVPKATAGKMFTLSRSGEFLIVKANLPSNTRGNLLVTNMLGQVILRREVLEKERVEINQNARTGVYVISLVSGESTCSEKVIMRKDYE